MAEAALTLDHLLDPVAECLTPEVVQRIVDLRTDDRAQARLETLRARANEGALSAAEQAEYEELVEGLDLLAILKAKSRAILDKRRK